MSPLVAPTISYRSSATIPTRQLKMWGKSSGFMSDGTFRSILLTALESKSSG